MNSKLALLAAVSTMVVVSGLGSVANAAVVDFESKPAFSCSSSTQSDGGMTFTHNFFACYYSPANPADFPTAPPSTVMAIGFSPITMARDDLSTFSLQSLDLAFGPFGHGGAITNTTLVTGYLTGGGTVSTTLNIGFGFQNYALNWSGLSSVVFGELSGNSEYLAFDNIVYNGGAVPEPATWAMMIVGFGLVGTTLRSTRRRNATVA